MASHVAQAFSTFHNYLSGQRAPALISQALATVVAQDPKTVAEAVAEWAYENAYPDHFAALIQARNRVFDIFFYRVVRFRRIFDFFDKFEDSLVLAIAPGDRAYLAQLLAEYPWREIRPLGSFRDPLEYALDKRRSAPVKRGAFNEALYRNATHQILSVDKRHTFDDERTESLVSLYQSQLAGVFDDFVDLIKDPQQRREILLANTADKHAIYAAKSRFDIANYISHLMEFVIALINDDFFEHGIQVFNVVRQIHKDFNLDIRTLYAQRFKTQSDLIDRQKLAEYSADPTRSVLLRSLLPLFESWPPAQLLDTILVEQDRRSRKLAVSLLGAYGSEVYELVVKTLATCTPVTPWYYVRNLAYILGRITTGNDLLKQRAVRSLAPYVDLSARRQLNLQVIAALGFIGTADAVQLLTVKLEEFGAQFEDPDCAEVCHKIVSALFGIGTEPAVEAAGQFCIAKNLVAQYRQDFARVSLSRSLREQLVATIRKEVRKLRVTRSLLGNVSSARTLLGAVGHAGYPETDELCRELAAAFPADHPLAVESARLLETPPPPPMLSSDRRLHAFLTKVDLAQTLCYAFDAGTSGRIDVQTRIGAECWIDLHHGQVITAEISNSHLEKERALYWICLLEPRDIAAVRFTPANHMSTAGAIQVPTADLLRDVLFQRAEVRQIIDGIISPESSFKRREVHAIYTDFSRLPNAQKYGVVWHALAQETDMETLRGRTGLSRHDIFRILLYFHRRNMLSVDGGRRDEGEARVADAVATIEVYISRIKERPLQFRFYHTAAEGCLFLERQIEDEAIQVAARALHDYLLEAYSEHRAFVEENIEICRRTLEMVSEYHRSGDDTIRQSLVDYVNFTFASVSPTISLPTLAARSLLEQLENIEFCNDPFDPAGQDTSKRTADDLVKAIHQTLTSSGVSVEALASGEKPTETEAQIILDIFRDVAPAFTKPIKDFVRELRRAHAARQSTSTGWLRVIEPSVRLLYYVAGAMHCNQMMAILRHMGRTIAEAKEQDTREVPMSVCETVFAGHRRLSELAPLAFALDLSDEQLAVKKSELLSTFILRQMDGMSNDILTRLAIAGLTTFEAFLETLPEDIAVSTGLNPALAEGIFMKFYQYLDMVRYGRDPVTHPKYAAMFEIGLTTLKEICVEIERIDYADHATSDTDPARKESLIRSRQQALASLLTLLCLREKYGLIESIQLASFETRVLLLDEHFAEITNEADPSAPRPSSTGPSRADAMA